MDAYKRPGDFGHEHFANYLKFVLQKNYVYHPYTIHNWSFSENTSENKIDRPTWPLTIRFLPPNWYVFKNELYVLTTSSYRIHSPIKAKGYKQKILFCVGTEKQEFGIARR